MRVPRRQAIVYAGLVAVTIGLSAIWLAGQTPAPSGPTTALPAPHYVEEARAAGLEHAYEGGFEFFVGGGVAAFDCNADRLIDLYFAGGSEPASLFVNRSPRGGGLRFEQRPAPATDLKAVTGAYPIDIDGDGIADLAVLRRGDNRLLRGLGDCRFEPANGQWSFDGGDSWSTAFSARWDDDASWPTVAVGNYHDEEFTDNERLCFDNELYMPAAGGRGFAAPLALSPGWCPLSMLFSDWDRSGRRDLRVSNDRHYYSDYSGGEEQLWRIERGGAPRLYTAQEGWKTLRVWGMGIASHDVTGDGYPDYYLTSQGDNKLQTLADGPQQPSYEDIALRRNAIAHRPFVGDVNMASTAWHDEFQDVNNDGLIDLFVAKGNVEAMPDYAARDPSNLLIGQADGTFVEGAMEAGIVDFSRARGAALVDLNLDGMLDLVVVKRLANVRLYRNVGSGRADAPRQMGNWIALSLHQPGANRHAIGAWIEVRIGDRVINHEVTIGGGHVSGQLGPAHFGLGRFQITEVRVIWPDGEIGEWQTVQANMGYLVERGAPSPVAQP